MARDERDLLTPGLHHPRTSAAALAPTTAPRALGAWPCATAEPGAPPGRPGDPPSGRAWIPDPEQLDLEPQRRARRNLVAGALVAIPERRRDDQRPQPAHLHRRQPLLPS